MSVFLNSTPQEDGNLLNGSVAMHGTSVFNYSIVAYREETQQPGGQWLEFVSGGQFVGIWDSYGTYLEAGDTGFTFRWKIWARGSGTLAFTQDTDPTWSTAALPVVGIGTAAVSSGGWALYHVTASAIDLTAFLDFDGIRLGIELLSGAVDITTIQLECVPDSGVTGWWRNETTDDNDVELEAAAVRRSIFTIPTAYIDGTRQETWDAAYDMVLATNPVDETDPDVVGPEFLGDDITTGSPSWARINDVIDPPGADFATTFAMGVSKLWVQTSVGTYPALNGDEGVDYIRVPGFVTYDGSYRLARSAANRANPPSSFANWQTPHAVYFRDQGTYHAGDFEHMNLKIWFTVAEEESKYNQDPIVWGGGSAATASKTITPVSDELQVEEITLPSNGNVVVYSFASALTGEDETKPVLPSDDNGGAYFAAAITLQSDPVGEVSVAKPLLYNLHFDAYSVWDPEAVPPGGKLKVRLPDNTWRIVGDEAGSGTERLKLQTPDLTWWKEYRASDGAVPVHPLKLYTADGWVFVGNMTPE